MLYEVGGVEMRRIFMQKQSTRQNAQMSAGFAVIGSLTLVGLLCCAHITGNTLFILAVLAAYIVFVIVMAERNMGYESILFFLPWSPLLKLYSGGISWFTIALFLYCALCLFKKKMKFLSYQFVVTVILMALTLLAKLIQGNGIESSYIFFFAMLVIFPCAVTCEADKSSFWNLTIFFSLGIISAAFAAQFTDGYANISKFITVHSYQSITRLSGFYADPNFYSAHISACLGGVLTLLSYEKTSRKRLLLAALTIVLIYCGLLSASKSFIIIIACLFLIWIIAIMSKRGGKAAKLRILLGTICAAAIMLSSAAVQELLRMMSQRFSYHANISQITTGRTEIWLHYLKEFVDNPLVLLFGQGYTNVLVGGRASHNSAIQTIFQFGLIASPILLLWILGAMRIISQKLRSVEWKFALLMLVGIVLPWMGLDILFFDEFFILPLYGILAVAYCDGCSAKQ